MSYLPLTYHSNLLYILDDLDPVIPDMTYYEGMTYYTGGSHYGPAGVHVGDQWRG